MNHPTKLGPFSGTNEHWCRIQRDPYIDTSHPYHRPTKYIERPDFTNTYVASPQRAVLADGRKAVSIAVDHVQTVAVLDNGEVRASAARGSGGTS